MNSRKRVILINSMCNQINNQRLDLLKLKYELIIRTKNYDNYWLIFVNMQKYLLLGSSILLIWSTKLQRINALFNWTKYGFRYGLRFFYIWKAIRYFI
ncbi:hypothetical protein CRV10_02350 [Candidatus Pantoea edessiphila]|uniref:Transmembrane protein n=1 Tax=Candidatus Pantoea edessiphila TaxID=2044610 RepID=A0A2P5SVU0_9GAMM|nr:hypothetical protein CRV10_02350 [Candidatus Pantoea edessiphila]